MATTYKFKVTVSIKDNHGISKTIYPIIEATTTTEAMQIAKAQYSNGNVTGASKIS